MADEGHLRQILGRRDVAALLNVRDMLLILIMRPFEYPFKNSTE